MFVRVGRNQLNAQGVEGFGYAELSQPRSFPGRCFADGLLLDKRFQSSIDFGRSKFFSSPGELFDFVKEALYFRFS